MDAWTPGHCISFLGMILVLQDHRRRRRRRWQPGFGVMDYRFELLLVGKSAMWKKEGRHQNHFSTRELTFCHHRRPLTMNTMGIRTVRMLGFWLLCYSGSADCCFDTASWDVHLSASKSLTFYGHHGVYCSFGSVV